MTLEYLQYAIGEIAVRNNLVNWYGAGPSVFAINGETVKDYPLVFVSPTGDNLVRENTTRYSLTIYYVDRLLDDSSNETNVGSVAVETLKNIYRQVQMIDWVEAVETDPRIRLFQEPERFNDRCAGAYMQVWIEVVNPSNCPVYFDETGYPLGNWIPNGITQNVLDNLASKPWVYQVIADINGIDPSVIEALVTKLGNYTLTRDFATINGDKITEGGDFELATKTDKENLQEQIDGNADDIHDLDVRVTDLENASVDWATTGDTQDIQNQITAITNNYATTAVTNDLQTQISAITQDLSNYATTAVTEDLQRQIDVLTGDTHDLDVRVTELENQSVDWATTGDTADLQSQIDTLTGQTAELSGITQNLQNSKQDKLTAGWGINITGNTIEETVPVFKAVYDWSNISEVNDYVAEKWGTVADIRFVIIWNGYAFACEASGSASWYGGSLKTNYMMYPAVKIASVLMDNGNLSVNEQDVDYRTFATASQLANKQDTLTAGTGITIQNNVISATAVGIQSAPGSPNQVTCIWSGSQSAYEAIGAGNYHNDWLYFIDRQQ